MIFYILGYFIFLGVIIILQLCLVSCFIKVFCELYFRESYKRIYGQNYMMPTACMLSHFSHVPLFVTPQTVTYQAPLSMGFSRQEYWSGLPFPPPVDPLDPGIEPVSPVTPTLQTDSLPLEPPGKPLMPSICSKITHWQGGSRIWKKDYQEIC